METYTETELQIKHRDDVQLAVEMKNAFMYALYHNHQPLITSISITNNSHEFLTNIKVIISSELGFFETLTIDVEDIAAGNTKVIKYPEFKALPTEIAALTERSLNPVKIAVISENEEIAEYSSDVWVYAYNQWPGKIYDVDLLASFVMPNHPVVSSILLSASKWLEKNTGDPSLDGYQSKDKERVINLATGIYAALQEKNIVYSNPLSSYVDLDTYNNGQRIRLADEIMDTRLATCLDISLLYAACLEAISLHPILVLFNDHIFTGLWLIDYDFQNQFIDDSDEIKKRLSDGVNEIALVECTSMCAGASVDFDTARKKAETQIKENSEFYQAIDVYRARTSKIWPMPLLYKSEGGMMIEHKERDESELTGLSKSKVSNIDFEQLYANSEKNVTKQVQWERKLLDLSQRNMLINARPKSLVSILVNEDLMEELEHNLSDGQEFEILERPVEWELHEMECADAELVADLGPYEKVIGQELKYHRLHSWNTAENVKKSLTRMYRIAKTSMEENGASTLYLALGMLEWVEGIRTKKIHYAPLILLPINLKTKAGNKGFVVSLRDDDEQVNITLLEFLKQNYGMDIPGLDPIPKNEHGIDLERIIAIFRHSIMDREGWKVHGTAFIGNFSFSQFVMWNDMHNGNTDLESNKIVKSLITGIVDWEDELPEDIDEGDAYLPVSVDASQLRAINMAANDVSFVLHGPPGTGKSQTITAMIANALTRGKTVLFVAEKMAALSVVQKRLAALGIGDFCLELHSNKAIKKNVLDQLKRTLDINVWGDKSEYDEKIQELHAMRSRLDSYMNSLHREQAFGMSVRDAIDEYESIPDHGTYLHFKDDFLEKIKRTTFTEHRKLIEKYVNTTRIIGDAKSNPFYGACKTDYSQSFKISLEDKIAYFGKHISELKDALVEFTECTGISAPVSEDQWNDLCAMVSRFSQPQDIPEFILEAESPEEIFDRLIEFAGIKYAHDNRKEYISSQWEDSFFKADFSGFMQRYDEAGLLYKNKYEAWEAYETAADKCTFADVCKALGSDENHQSINQIAEKVTILRSQIDELRMEADRLTDIIAVPRPVTAMQWKDMKTVSYILVNPLPIPMSVVTSASFDAEFNAPLDYVRRKAEFDVKKSYIGGIWNDSFLALDMTRYQLKYDEAGKKLLGKKKAYEQLAAELRAFAKTDIVIEQIPVRLAEVISFQEENRKFEAFYNSLSYEWRDIVEKYYTVESLGQYKEYCRKQITENGEALRISNNLKCQGKYDAAVSIASRFNSNINAVIQLCDEICGIIGYANIEAANDWLGIRDVFCGFMEYSVSKIKACAPLMEELKPYAKTEIYVSDIPVKINEVTSFLSDLARYEELNGSIKDEWREVLEKYPGSAIMAEYKEFCCKAIADDKELLLVCARLAREGKTEAAVELGSRLIGRFDEVDTLFNEITGMLQIDPKGTEKNWLGAREKFQKLVENNMSELKDWINYSSAVRDCRAAGLEELIEKAEKGLELDKLQDVYFKSVYRSLALMAIENDDVLNGFTGTSFEQKVIDYKQLEDEFINLTKEEMYYKLTHNLPTSYQSPEISKELAVLKKAIASGARGMSIRTLFDQIPHILTRLCPCMLMSPISVSQYLTKECDPFDIVVFDEASQLPTCKAVGVLARGKNAVIVGDPNQMPPTSFFAGNMIDEDNLDLEDLDSILDDCLALGMPSTHLKWHYRSRHESLIAFSNHKYYDNSMLTFPSVNDREKRVKLVTINGCFNRKEGRINKEEGAAVIKEIRRRYESETLKKQSIGVVTFNIIQQRYIIDLLDAEYSKDLEFEKWAKSGEEPLFVKNLENVQGDERDVILFSIGFGPDEEGKLSLNFGPLNKEGGWKRLNVAISRAKYEMIVFSSMTPEMIDTSRTKAKGVEGLKGFLSFAKTGEFLDEQMTASTYSHKGITDKICEAIENAGYTVARGVGHSDFKVDIAVVNPYDENEYLLGILLDGDSYKRVSRTKDREVSQAEVLGGLGWRLHRVWAIDWWDDCDKEISKIIKLIETYKVEAESNSGKEKEGGPESEEIAPLKPRALAKRSTKKKEENIEKSNAFDIHERFTPKVERVKREKPEKLTDD